MAFRPLVFAAFALFSCGSPQGAKDAHPLPTADARPLPPPAKRAPSAEIAKYFSVPDATMLAYGVGGGDAMRVFSSSATLDAATAKCLADTVRATREVVYATTPSGALGALRYDATALDAKACFGGALVPVTADVALFGSSALVERAKLGGGSLPASLALADGEWLRLTFDQKPARGTASVTSTSALFAIHAEADIPEAEARELVKNLEETRAKVPNMMKEATSDERDTIAKILRFTTFRRDGGHVTFAIELREPPLDQARDIGTMAALAIAGVRKYLLQSKEAEARATVGAISRDIAMSWERETLVPTPRAKKKLQSFPPIPQLVPRGTKYQSSEKEWAAWSELKFEMDQPQYYQYEVRAAKDGESAQVIARGDLNGDGKTSSFVINVTVTKDKSRTLVFSPIVETDPDE